mgnify:FL=1
MAGKRYPVVKGGQPVKLNWRKTSLYAACCDCSLVHRVRFTVQRDVLTLRTWREKGETKRLRKRDGVVYTIHPVKSRRAG